MIYIFKLSSILIIFNILISCSEKITYSGKILNDNMVDYSKFQNIAEVIEFMGQPNYIDPIEKKYYYYSEQKNIQNFFKQKITNRKIIVFLYDENLIINSYDQYNLDSQNEIEYVKDKTSNEVINRGIIEKIFGGVGNTMPNSIE